jgi:hypothetical protein
MTSQRRASQLTKLTTGVSTLRRRVEQLSALRAGADQAGAQIARLERALDFDRVAAHVRAAVMQALRASDAVAHLLVIDLVPSETYQALIDAIPAPAFFDGDAERGEELRVPPRGVPTTSLVTYAFVHEIGRLVANLLLTSLAEPLASYTRARFPSLPPFRDWPVDIPLTEGRLVRRRPGYIGRRPPDRPWQLASGVLDLARAHETEEFGGTLQGAVIPFRANTLLAYVGPPDVHAYASIPVDAPAGTERYAYEFGIGPARDDRRTLAGLTGNRA